MNIIVLGAGLVGNPMAVDLANEDKFSVTVADISEETLARLSGHSKIKTLQMDLSDPEKIKALVGDYDLVINALPGCIGYQSLEAVLKTGKNIVDIAFFPEDPFQLNDLAVKNDVTAIVDCGVSPGMTSTLIGYVDHLLDETESALVLVGGLPVIREQPYEYKAVFSPVDVIEEYIRPARYIENGKLVIKPALSDTENIDFDNVGTLEAFNSDGLRTLIDTIKIKNMKEKTMRYPGHVEKMLMLRETGFFDQKEIPINGSMIRPVDFTAKLLFPKWKLEEGDEDITVLRVVIEGRNNGNRLRYTYDLFDRYDKSTQTHSMARTTGYTATVAVRMIESGLYTRKGISAPEHIGKQPECVDFLLKGLKERGVIYEENIEQID
ncbi:MAG: saccharopine dehydrogenase [bacterium]|nr:saccharopine dehydrogenase [bacterium]